MIIKNSSFERFLNFIGNYKGFLIYGPDKGFVKDRASKIIERLNVNSVKEVKKLSQTDLDNNTLYDLIFQKSIFSDKSIINIDLDYISPVKFDVDFFVNGITGDPNYLLLEAGNLSKNEKLVKYFSKNEALACVPCYHDTENTINQTINYYSKKLNLLLDKESIDYLSKRLGNDKLLTIQELKKLAIYGDGNPVSYNDVLVSIGDSSLITINKICDHLFNSNQAPYYFEKIIEQGFSSIIVLRSLLSHFRFLLNIKEDQSFDISKLNNFIHFSRKSLVEKQLSSLSSNRIKKIISNIYDLEKKTKQDFSVSNLLIKKFLLFYSKS